MDCKACKNNTGAKGRGSDLIFATQSDPIRTRDGLGAVLKEERPSYRCFTATRGRSSTNRSSRPEFHRLLLAGCKSMTILSTDKK